MEVLIVITLVLIFMIIETVRIRKLDIILKKVMFEDKIETHAGTPLFRDEYKKIFKEDFRAYPMKFSTDVNKAIFRRFEKFYSDANSTNFKKPNELHMIFVNKIDGYIHNPDNNKFEAIIQGDPILFKTHNRRYIDIIDDVMSLKYTQINEFNIDGIINFNNKKYALGDLTSISITSNDKEEKIQTIFMFGSTTESITFNSYKDFIDYLFNSDKSDIRLIQKIANSALIRVKGVS